MLPAGFNSRTLGRVRQSDGFRTPSWHKFQFTHPGKGATPCAGCCLWGCSVSIHAPWEGCDINACNVVSQISSFNSRTLGRVRRARLALARLVALSFNSRTLGRVRHESGVRQKNALTVSIHAPWEGCDGSGNNLRDINLSFNSRTLGRVRLLSSSNSSSKASFNSRTLGRVRLCGMVHCWG